MEHTAPHPSQGLLLTLVSEGEVAPCLYQGHREGDVVHVNSGPGCKCHKLLVIFKACGRFLVNVVGAHRTDLCRGGLPALSLVSRVVRPQRMIERAMSRLS